jgi:hypothetical protein
MDIKSEIHFLQKHIKDVKNPCATGISFMNPQFNPLFDGSRQWGNQNTYQGKVRFLIRSATIHIRKLQIRCFP